MFGFFLSMIVFMDDERMSNYISRFAKQTKIDL